MSEILPDPDIANAPPAQEQEETPYARFDTTTQTSMGPPATLPADPKSPGESPVSGKGPFIFLRSPSRTWSTERLERYVAMLHAEIADGADPALVAPSINSANAILKKRCARKDDDVAENVGNDTAPER